MHERVVRHLCAVMAASWRHQMATAGIMKRRASMAGGRSGNGGGVMAYKKIKRHRG